MNNTMKGHVKRAAAAATATGASAMVLYSLLAPYWSGM